MARVIRQHWRLALLQLLVVVAGVGLPVHRVLKSPELAAAITADAVAPNGGTSAPQQSTVSFKDKLLAVNHYHRVSQLREKLTLQNLDMAAMGCTCDQATRSLQILSNWAGTNSASWHQQEQIQIVAENTLAAALRQINVGPRDESVLAQLPSLQRNVASARQQTHQFLESATASLAAVFTATQQKIWATARSNVALGIPDRFRYAQGLTSEQAKALNLSVHRGESGEKALSYQAAQELQAAKQNIKQNMPGILVA